MSNFVVIIWIKLTIFGEFEKFVEIQGTAANVLRIAAKWVGMLTMYRGRIQCEVLTTLPFCFSRIKKFLGQQLKIWDDSLVEKSFG